MTCDPIDLMENWLERLKFWDNCQYMGQWQQYSKHRIPCLFNGPCPFQKTHPYHKVCGLNDFKAEIVKILL